MPTVENSIAHLDRAAPPAGFDRGPSRWTIVASFCPLLAVMLFAAGVTHVFAWYYPDLDRWAIFFDFALIVLAFIALAWSIISWICSRVVITPRTGRVRTGVMIRTVIDFNLRDVERVELAPPTLQSMLGLRTIDLVGRDLPRGRVSLFSWRDAEQVRSQLSELVAAVVPTRTGASDMLPTEHHEPASR